MTDPLKVHGPDNQRILFGLLADLCKGFSTEDVTGAAINLLINAVRQAHPSRDAAMQSVDHMVANAKSLLAQNYDLTGKRRNVFPFHQNIEMPLFRNPNRN